MAVNETQAVFQAYQCMHQWTQPCTHPLTAKSGIAFPFPASGGVGLNSLMERPEQLPADEAVNKTGYRSYMWVILVKVTQ